MLAQLPFEIVDHIVEYLDLNTVHSIACVCSALRLPAQRRIFRTVQIVSYYNDPYPEHIDSILSSPHLLQCSSSLHIGPVYMEEPFINSLWSHLPTMSRLRSMHILLQPDECSIALSALESLGSTREIALNVRHSLGPDMLISDHPLPVHLLDVYVDTPTHHVVTRLAQKCSQSLRTLVIFLLDNITPPLPFLPHLHELTIGTTMSLIRDDPDLVSWFPFFSQHPTITRIVLGDRFTLAGQPPPDLLPNLQFIYATPAIIERLAPGRPVNHIHAEYYPGTAQQFPDDIMLRPLRQPFVSVTTLEIMTNRHLPNDGLINIVQALPKLCDFSVDWFGDEVRRLFEGRMVFRIDWKQVSTALLTALGKCKDMVHISLHPSKMRVYSNGDGPLYSRGDFVQMVQGLQENGAVGLRSFELRVTVSFRQEGCRAMRIGWLDVPRQPTLRGEWLFDMVGSSSDSDIPLSA